MINIIKETGEKVKSDFLISQMQGYNLTKALIQQELTGIFNTETLKDMNHILEMYKVYMEGADFLPDTNNDYIPAKWSSKTIKTLVDKEARFMFSIPPDVTFSDKGESSKSGDKVLASEALVIEVFKNSKFNSKLVKAAKDCLIGKRIAIATNYNKDGITTTFIPSMEFVYETDPQNVDKITKFIQFYNTVVNTDKDQQRIYKKKWWMAEDGFCHVVEEVYNGYAVLIDTLLEEVKTPLTWMPVEVIVNDGLSGDPFGVSEIDSLEDNESWYSKLSSKDMDAIRKGADQIVYAMDVDPRTTKGLSRGPGAFWDMQSDPNSEDRSGSVGVVNNNMEYSTALEATLARLKQAMYNQLDVPDTGRDALQGILTNGKTMKAIYWGLMVRCDEKMLDWIPAIENTIRNIIFGAMLFPDSKAVYDVGEITDEYDLVVENTYPLLEDELEEKATDMLEVNTKVMSRKAYMKKHRALNDEEVTQELEQIALEVQMLEQDNFNNMFNTGGGAE